MRALIFSLLVLVAPHQFALANDDNGVERGDVTVTENSSIPEGLEDRLESLIFGNCNLRGASAITTSYLKVSDGRLDGSRANDYQIQYRVDFKNASSPAIISVHALLRLDAASADNAVELLSLVSPICKSLP